MYRMNGVANERDVRILGTGRSEEYNLVIMNSPGVMTRCAALKSCRRSRYFFGNVNATGECYRNMIINYTFSRS